MQVLVRVRQFTIYSNVHLCIKEWERLTLLYLNFMFRRMLFR